jgi:hypothetical protein
MYQPMKNYKKNYPGRCVDRPNVMAIFAYRVYGTFHA